MLVAFTCCVLTSSALNWEDSKIRVYCTRVITAVHCTRVTRINQQWGQGYTEHIVIKLSVVTVWYYVIWYLHACIYIPVVWLHIIIVLLVSPPQKLQCTHRRAGFLSSLDPQYSCGLVGILSHYQCRKDRGRHRIQTPQVDSLGVRKSTDIYMGILIAVGSTYHL